MTIDITSFETTGLSPEYNYLKVLRLSSSYMGKGNFGEVYACEEINHQRCKGPLVIKLLLGKPKVVNQGFETIQKLQGKLKRKHEELQLQGMHLHDQYPALLACPQFCFKGLRNGEEVIGYGAIDLSTLGYQDFDKLLYEKQDLANYRKIPIIGQLQMALQVVKAFELLQSFLYVHADFKADSLFVNVEKMSCAIIDFDSGAIMQFSGDEPTTLGTRQSWLAPEINRQIDERQQKDEDGVGEVTVKVNLLSDMWSVAMCVHFLIFTLHPYSSFEETSERSIRAYLDSNANFPNLPSDFPYRAKNANASKVEAAHVNRFKKLSSSLQQKLQESFCEGYFDPQRRISYSQWGIVLAQSQEPPSIRLLEALPNPVADDQGVLVKWSVSNAHQIWIDEEDVSQLSEFRMPIKRDTTLVFVAKNLVHKVQRNLSIKVSKTPPIIQYFEADAPTERLHNSKRLTLKWAVTGYHSLDIDQGLGDVSGMHELTIDSPRRDTTYQLTAISYFGQKSSKTLNVRVSKVPPEIKYFQANQTIRTGSSPLRLSWQVQHAEKLTLEPGDIDVSGRSSHDVSPRVDTTYTLYAESYFGAKSSQSLDLTVSKRPPVVAQFEALPTERQDERPIELKWQVLGAEKVKITPKPGTVQESGQQKVRPTRDTTYTLEAISYFGITTIRQLMVSVSKAPPKILSFQADRALRENEKPVTLTWEAANFQSIRLLPDNIEVTSRSSYDVTPEQDTTYQLEVETLFGVKATRSLTVEVSKSPPVIELFEARPALRSNKQPVILSWRVKNAKSVKIEPFEEGLSIQGEKHVTPIEDTQYTLTACSLFGVISQETIEVRVSREAPRISQFDYQAKDLLSDEYELFWEVENADSKLLYPGPVDVTEMDSFDVSDGTTHFRLKVTSLFGVSSEKQLKITPVFTADPGADLFVSDPGDHVFNL